MLEIRYEMFQQAGGGGADIRLGDAVAELCLGNESLEELPLFFIFFDAVKVEEVIDTQSMRAGYPAVYGNGGLEEPEVPIRTILSTV